MDLSVVGPMARSARDLALALSVLGGPNGDDAKAWHWRMPKSRHARLKDFRIGYVFDDPAAPLASDVRLVYEDAISALRTTGATIEEGWPAEIDSHAQARTFGYLLG